MAMSIWPVFLSADVYPPLPSFFGFGQCRKPFLPLTLAFGPNAWSPAAIASSLVGSPLYLRRGVRQNRAQS